VLVSSLCQHAGAGADSGGGMPHVSVLLSWRWQQSTCVGMLVLVLAVVAGQMRWYVVVVEVLVVLVAVAAACHMCWYCRGCQTAGDAGGSGSSSSQRVSACWCWCWCWRRRQVTRGGIVVFVEVPVVLVAVAAVSHMLWYCRRRGDGGRRCQQSCN
jgi:hypothetical protein